RCAPRAPCSRAQRSVSSVSTSARGRAAKSSCRCPSATSSSKARASRNDHELSQHRDHNMTLPTRLLAFLAPLLLAALFGLALAGAPVARAQDTAASGTAAASSGAPAATAAPASEAAAPLAATTTKETVDNPYGLGALWAQGDFVARGTLGILFIMSLGSWYILITKLYESIKISRE